jgi:hypothetical protein
MAKRKQPTPAASGGAEVKAQAVVKATYEVKKRVTQHIPDDVTRSRNSAWLDLISPVTEWAGLKGDELRARRDALRLQREDVLSKIIEQAMPKLKFISGTALPNKFTVPFLEQASLEAPESSLIDLWSDLLVSASEKFESYHTHFVSIIARLSAKQADLFKQLIRVESQHDLEIALDNIHTWYTQYRIRSLVYRGLHEVVTKSREELTADQINDELRNILAQPGIDPVYASFDFPSGKSQPDIYEVEADWAIYRDEHEVDYSILEAVGLIRRVESYFEIAAVDFQLIYYHVTDLGGHFARSCGLVSREDDPKSVQRI